MPKKTRIRECPNCGGLVSPWREALGGVTIAEGYHCENSYPGRGAGRAVPIEDCTRPYTPRVEVEVPEQRGAIYFVQCEETKRVKIGFSRNPKCRLSTLQSGSPTVLRLVTTIPDVTLEDESKLHAQHAEHHIRGEWFTDAVLR